MFLVHLNLSAVEEVVEWKGETERERKLKIKHYRFKVIQHQINICNKLNTNR